MTNSAFRRNVAEHLGIASAADIKARRRALSREEADAVCAWSDGCEVVWKTCDSEAEAIDVERNLKAEYMPPLTKL
jgi:hypothetical protein